MSTLAHALDPVWFLPTLVPALAQALTFLHDNFLYRSNDYADQVNLLKDTNKVGKAKALKSFVETLLNNTSLPGATDDRLQERCLDLASEMTRRGAHDVVLDGCRNGYNLVSKLAFSCFLLDIVMGLASLVIGIAYPSTRMWWFGAGMVLATGSVVFLIYMMRLTSRLNGLKSNEDLRA